MNKSFFLLLSGILFSFAGTQFSLAQKITHEEVFDVSYPIANVGYPLNIVPTAKDEFAYIEFWLEGEGRKFTNHYVQNFNEKYEETWFKPVTKDQSPKFNEIISLSRFDESVAVIGYQYSESIKRMAVKMQFYGFDGSEKGGLMTVSEYDKKAKKGFIDEFSFSPDKSKMLWFGHNPSASAKKRAFFGSVWTGSGKKSWGRKIYIPQAAEKKYKVAQAIVDDRGNAYFYMVFEEMTNTIKDTLNRPIIIRYDSKENNISEYQINSPGASVPEGRIHVTKDGKLAFLGVLSDGTAGFANGANRYGTALNWNKLVFKVFNVERTLQLDKEYVMDFPESWTERYASRGSDFSKSEIIEHKGKLYWVMEEFYTTMHNNELQYRYYDVATIGFDLGSGTIDWATTFEKKQRDYKSGRLLSYVCGISGGKLRFVYLNERGAQGKIICTSMDLKTGETVSGALAKNENADYLFFPSRSSMVSDNKMMLMGIGNPVGNDYKLIEITF